MDATLITSQPVTATVKSGAKVTVRANADETGIEVIGTGNETTLDPEQVEKDTTPPVINNAALVIDGAALLVKFSINETIDLSTEADVKLSYFTKVDDVLTPMTNSKEDGSALVKDKTWAGYLANVNEPARNYSTGTENNANYFDEIVANTLIGSKVQKGYQNPGTDMDYVEITDFNNAPGTYVVKIQVTDNAGNTSEEIVELVVEN